MRRKEHVSSDDLDDRLVDGEMQKLLRAHIMCMQSVYERHIWLIEESKAFFISLKIHMLSRLDRVLTAHM